MSPSFPIHPIGMKAGLKEIVSLGTSFPKRRHRRTAAARDAVKKEALRRAGIAYHEVIAGHTTPSELARLVERLVDVPTEMAQ